MPKKVKPKRRTVTLKQFRRMTAAQKQVALIEAILLDDPTEQQMNRLFSVLREKPNAARMGGGVLME